MQRTFLTNLALVLVLNLLVKPFYILGIDAGVQGAVGSAAYGTYAALLSLGFLLNIVLDLGLTNYNTRHIAQHEHLMGKYLAGMVGVRVALTALYAVLTLGAGLVLGYHGEQLSMLAWIAVNQVLVATILYLRSNIAGAQRYAQDSVLSVLDRVLLIGMVGWLLWGRTSGEPFRIEWFIRAQTVAYGITALVALGMVLRLSGRVRVGWNTAFNRVVLRQSFPYALLVLLMTFYYRIDTLMLERLLPNGAEEAGIYAQGFRFFEAFNMLGFLFAGLLLPMFSRMLKEKADVGPLVLLSFRLVLAAALGVAVLGSLEAHAVMDLRYDEHLDRSAPAFSVLIWCFAAVSTTYIFGTLLTAGGNLRQLNWMAAGGAVLNIVLNLVLVPRWQAEGAAWAGLITQGLTAAVQVVLAARMFRLPALTGVAVRALVLTAVLVGTVLGLRAAGASFGMLVAAYVAVGTVAALATGMVDLRALRAVLATKAQ